MDESGRPKVRESPPRVVTRDNSPKRSSVWSQAFEAIGYIDNPEDAAKDPTCQETFLKKIAKWMGPIYTEWADEVYRGSPEAPAVTVNWLDWLKPLNLFLHGREHNWANYHYTIVVAFFLLRLQSGYQEASYPLQLLLQRFIYLRRRSEYPLVERLRDKLMEFLRKDLVSEHFWALLEDHITSGSSFVDLYEGHKMKRVIFYSNPFSEPAITNEPWAISFRMYARKPKAVPEGVVIHVHPGPMAK
jgi:hypothetical protein